MKRSSAIGGVLNQGTETGAQSSNAEVISLASIAEDTSQTVKAVNSTLYDALKSGASDIHLETTSGRSDCQIPHRRCAVPRRSRLPGWIWPNR